MYTVSDRPSPPYWYETPSLGSSYLWGSPRNNIGPMRFGNTSGDGSKLHDARARSGDGIHR